MGLYKFFPCTSLVSRLRADFHFFFFFLSTCGIARGREETSTS